MQFDGVDDAVYEKLRRRPMLEVKKRAIEQCGRYGIGVTLVPVIVPGVNTEQIGDTSDCHSAVAVCARRAFPAGQLFWTYPGASSG